MVVKLLEAESVGLLLFDDVDVFCLLMALLQ